MEAGSLPDHRERFISSGWYYTFIFIIFFAGTGFYFYATPCGLNLTDDSAAYLQNALLDYKGNISPFSDAVSSSSWPPLFGSIIYFWKFQLGFNLVWLQWLIMSLNYLLLVISGKRHISDKGYRLAWLAICFAGVSFVMVHVFLWSESLFLVFLMSLVLSIENYMKNLSLPGLSLMILLSVLLCLQRNAGVLITSSVAVSILVSSSGRKALLGSLTIFLAGAITFLSWNLFVSVSPQEGFRFLDLPFLSGFILNIRDYFFTISAWFLPQLVPGYLRIILILFISIGTLWTLKHYEFFKDPISGDTLWIFWMIVFYIVGMSSLGRIDPWEAERYLSVIFPVSMLILFKCISGVNAAKIPGYYRSIMIILTLALLSYSMVRTANNVIRWHNRSCIQLYGNAVSNP